MNSVGQPNTSFCEHCGTVIYHSPKVLRQSNACGECNGLGKLYVHHPVCGHIKEQPCDVSVSTMNLARPVRKSEIWCGSAGTQLSESLAMIVGKVFGCGSASGLQICEVRSVADDTRTKGFAEVD